MSKKMENVDLSKCQADLVKPYFRNPVITTTTTWLHILMALHYWNTLGPVLDRFVQVDG